MSKLLKRKILVCLVSVLMVALVVGNIYSLAADEGGSGVLELTETGGTNNTNKSNKSKNNTSGNTTAEVDDEVGAQNKNTNSNKNSNTNKSSNNNTGNSSRYTNKNSSSGLPYAGSNSSIIFIVIALGVSAAYAYKKVSDYNV